jgi:hypothetical protein
LNKQAVAENETCFVLTNVPFKDQIKVIDWLPCIYTSRRPRKSEGKMRKTVLLNNFLGCDDIKNKHHFFPLLPIKGLKTSGKSLRPAHSL